MLFCFYALGLDLILPSTLQDLHQIDPKEFLVSEKLDGVRAYWNGKELLSKSGKNLHPPKEFIQNFPPFAIDGELFTKQRDFENIVSIVKKEPKNWQNLKLFVFEVPNQKGDLLQRLQVLEKFLKEHPHAPIKIIPQHQFQTTKQIQDFFKTLQDQGGEGIILRKKDAPYHTGRSALALKYKVYFDAECQIIDYQKGRGKYADMVGSILCKDQDKIFKIGSGFNEFFRKNPPKIGTIITYKYYQTTKNGLPKHPVFLRIFEDF